MGRAPRTKETLPDFLKWRRVTRPPLEFRGLTGSQRTLGFWGVTSERAELQALIQSLTDDVLGYKSDLKHTSTAKARAKDRNKKAIEGLRFTEDELRVVKEKFQAAREELCTKAVALDWTHRKTSEVEIFVERLAEEYNALRGNL